MYCALRRHSPPANSKWPKRWRCWTSHLPRCRRTSNPALCAKSPSCRVVSINRRLPMQSFGDYRATLQEYICKSAARLIDAIAVYICVAYHKAHALIQTVSRRARRVRRQLHRNCAAAPGLSNGRGIQRCANTAPTR